MSPTRWRQAFLGGVADAEGRHALWPDRSGKLVALRLADGQLLWRSAEPLWPLLLGQGLAIGLAPSPPCVVALALDGPAAGSVRWRSAALPGLASITAAAAAQLRAGWHADGIVLCWHSKPLYRGGAVPGPSRAKAAPTAGAVLLDVATGALHAAPPGSTGGDAEPCVQPPCDDPTVLAQQLLGGVRYRLQHGAAAGPVQTTLSAHDGATDRLLWRCVLDDTPSRGPRALRS